LWIVIVTAGHLLDTLDHERHTPSAADGMRGKQFGPTSRSAMPSPGSPACEIAVIACPSRPVLVSVLVVLSS